MNGMPPHLQPLENESHISAPHIAPLHTTHLSPPPTTPSLPTLHSNPQTTEPSETDHTQHHTTPPPHSRITTATHHHTSPSHTSPQRHYHHHRRSLTTSKRIGDRTTTTQPHTTGTPTDHDQNHKHTTKSEPQKLNKLHRSKTHQENRSNLSLSVPYRKTKRNSMDLKLSRAPTMVR